jgi:hypothetical protein
MKKTINNKPRTLKRIYVVIYDQNEFLGYEASTPIKAFKNKKTAEQYVDGRNFEFQTLCLHGEEQYANYVLDNEYRDFIVTMSDLRDAFSFVKEELLRLQKTGTKPSIWDILDDIKPFKVMPIEYSAE